MYTVIHVQQVLLWNLSNYDLQNKDTPLVMMLSTVPTTEVYKIT